MSKGKTKSNSHDKKRTLVFLTSKGLKKDKQKALNTQPNNSSNQTNEKRSGN